MSVGFINSTVINTLIMSSSIVEDENFKTVKGIIFKAIIVDKDSYFARTIIECRAYGKVADYIKLYSDGRPRLNLYLVGKLKNDLRKRYIYLHVITCSLCLENTIIKNLKTKDLDVVEADEVRGDFDVSQAG